MTALQWFGFAYQNILQTIITCHLYPITVFSCRVVASMGNIPGSTGNEGVSHRKHTQMSWDSASKLEWLEVPNTNRQGDEISTFKCKNKLQPRNYEATILPTFYPLIIKLLIPLLIIKVRQGFFSRTAQTIMDTSFTGIISARSRHRQTKWILFLYSQTFCWK